MLVNGRSLVQRPLSTIRPVLAIDKRLVIGQIV